MLALAPSKVATGAIFNAFGMARPGIEPTSSRSRSGRSTICAIGTGIGIYMGFEKMHETNQNFQTQKMPNL